MPRKAKKVIEESSDEENDEQEFEEQSAPEEETEEMEEEEDNNDEEADSEDEPIVKKPQRGRKAKNNNKEEESNEDDFEDEEPKTKRKRSSNSSKVTPAKRARKSKKTSDFEDEENEEEEEDDDDEKPIKKQSNRRKSSKKQESEEDEDNDEDSDDDDDSDDDEDKIIIKKSTPKKKAAPKKAKSKSSTTKKQTRTPRKSKKSDNNDEDSDDKPIKRKRKSKKSEGNEDDESDQDKHIKRKKLTIAQQLDMAMQSFKWWESPSHPEDIQWFTLEHNGVMFPLSYERHNIPIKYDNKIVKLNENEEEAATFYCQVALDGPQLGNPKTAPVFKKNFFRDFRAVLTPEHQKLITDFNKINFDDIRKHLDEEREVKKNRTKEEKEALKLERQGLQRQYGYAFVDGHLEKVGNFIIEPPGLFRGRGEHPKMGTIKLRVLPEQITLNCGRSEKIPKCPVPGHHWGNIVFKPDCTWLATWTENVMGSVKYVFLAPSSSFKGKSDLEKYEKARRLKNCISTIRKDYKNNLLSSDTQQRQLATAMWVIDRLALRVGNEKSEDEADTVGCCSLRVEHMKFEDPFLLTLDFIGKDSMRYRNTIDLSKYDKIGKQVFKNLKRFCSDKTPDKDVFDKLSVDYLNKHLQQLMPGLTAKVFRTFNASITLEAQLPKNIDIDTESAEKVRIYNTANREVAILCNHQRTEPKGHEKAMTGLNENLEICKKQLQDLQKWLKDVKKGKDIPLKPDNLEDLDKKEKMKYSHMYNRQPNESQIENRISTLVVKINTLEANIKNREENKTIALGTSKLNYMDPRITVAWCKRNEVPIEKLFATTLRAKFPWAMSVKSDWTF